VIEGFASTVKHTTIRSPFAGLVVGRLMAWLVVLAPLLPLLVCAIEGVSARAEPVSQSSTSMTALLSPETTASTILPASIAKPLPPRGGAIHAGPGLGTLPSQNV